jgi:PAS domain S-box-containing protein
LHVDDDPSILEISKQILIDMGNFEIDNACCVDEAFKKLSTGQYDVVVSDQEMPQKNGLDFLKELREKNNQIPFILFTGKGREEVAIKALNLGADGYHNKQGSPETVYGELAHSIKLIVERRKTKEELEEHEIRFSKLAAQTPGMLFQFLKRPDGTFCVPFASDKIRDVFGCTPQDVQKDFSPIIKAIVPEDLEKVISSIEQSAAHLSLWQCEYRIQLPGQKTRWMWGQSAPERLQEGSILWSGYNSDITERKKIEMSLKESEEKFRNLAEESPNMIFINLQGRVVYANKKCEDTIGYSKEEFYSPSFNFLSIIGPESTDLLKASYSKHWRGEDVHPYEYGLVTKDGRRIEAIINSKLIDYNGQKAILGLVTDITERKITEASLRQNEEQFRQLFSSMPSGVAVYEAVENGEDFVFRDFNSAAEKIEKVSKTDILGKHVTEVFPKVKSFGIFQVFQRVWRTGQPEYYPVALYKDEKDIGSWRENWVYKLPNGNIIAIYNDISERMKTDVALRQERNMLESVTAASGAGLVIISKDYHVLWANDFIKRYKGDTIGKLCYASLNSLDAPCQECGVAKIYAGKTILDSHEYCSATVDGNPYWVEIVATPLTDENGNVTSAVEIAVDITERKKNEEKLRESIYKNELINEKLKVVGRLTRHDVGNKLMVVKSNMYMLKKQIGDNPKLAQYLEGIDSAIDQSDKMFEFSRFYEKIGVEKPSKIDVAQCFNQASTLLSSFGTIRIVNDCEGLEVMADSLLKQLFYNFLDNSLKHGEKVTQIRLHYTKEGDGLKLFYEDNGVGIPEADKPKLFHEGFSTGKSTGLGLFLIKKMVEVYGWTISEEGEPGKGAKISITIPKLNKSDEENYLINQ